MKKQTLKIEMNQKNHFESNESFEVVKLKKLVGYKNFIDEETGEIEQFRLESQAPSYSSFHVLFLKQFCQVLKSLDCVPALVLSFFLENMGADMVVVGSEVEIAKKLELSRASVRSAIRNLLDSGFLVKEKKAVFLINPMILVKGKQERQAKLWARFRQAQINNAKQKRGDKNEEN